MLTQLGSTLGRLCGSQQLADFCFHLRNDGTVVPAHSAVIVPGCSVLAKQVMEVLAAGHCSGVQDAATMVGTATHACLDEASAPHLAAQAFEAPSSPQNAISNSSGLPSVHLSATVKADAFRLVLQYIYSHSLDVGSLEHKDLAAAASLARAMALHELAGLLHCRPLLPGQQLQRVEPNFASLVPTMLQSLSTSGAVSDAGADVPDIHDRQSHCGCSRQKSSAAGAVQGHSIAVHVLIDDSPCGRTIQGMACSHRPLFDQLSDAFDSKAHIPTQALVSLSADDERWGTADVLLAAPMLQCCNGEEVSVGDSRGHPRLACAAAHKALLSSSCEYFAALFSRTWTPSRQSGQCTKMGKVLPVVTVPESDAEVLLALVAFLYTGKLSIGGKVIPSHASELAMEASPVLTCTERMHGSRQAPEPAGCLEQQHSNCCCSAARIIARLLRLSDVLILPAFETTCRAALALQFQSMLPLACQVTLLADLCTLGLMEELDTCVKTLVDMVDSKMVPEASQLPEWQQLPQTLQEYMQQAWLEKRKSSTGSIGRPSAARHGTSEDVTAVSATQFQAEQGLVAEFSNLISASVLHDAAASPASVRIRGKQQQHYGKSILLQYAAEFYGELSNLLNVGG